MIDGHADFEDGSSASIVVETLGDGTVLVNPIEFSHTSLQVVPLVTGECSDTFQASDNGPYWTTMVQWWFHGSTTPSYLSLADTIADLRAATSNVTQENNSCGRADTFSGTSNYEGLTSSGVQINADLTCFPQGSSDGDSTIGFGPLNGGAIAITCNWDLFILGSHVARIESDIRMDNSRKWTTGSCAGQFASAYFVEGIATHERGHTWNALDFPNGHPNQTMGGANGQCPGSDAKQTLGLGDMLSLEAHY